jgi:DNA-binding protein YbaB
MTEEQLEEFQRIMEAAKAGTRSKEAMAEALALDIPHKVEGDGQVIEAALESARSQMIDAGYEDIPVGTLRNMRATALWVEKNRTTVVQFPWRGGTSFTAHQYAALGGMAWDKFSRSPLKTRDVQAMLGNKVTTTSVKKSVETMTAVEKVDMMRELASDDVNAFTDVVVEAQRDAVIKAAEKVKDKASEPTFKEPSTSTMNTKRLDALKDVMSRNVSFTNLVIQRWQREVEDLGGFVKAEDRRVMAGYLDGAAEQYTAFIDELEASV